MAFSNTPIRGDIANALSSGLLLSLDTNCITVPIVNPEYGKKSSSSTMDYMNNNSNPSNASIQFSNETDVNEPAHKKQKRRKSSNYFINSMASYRALSQQSLTLSQTVPSQMNMNENIALSHPMDQMNESKQSIVDEEENKSDHADVDVIDLTLSQTPELKIGFECTKCGTFFNDKGDIVRHLRDYEEVNGSAADLENFIKYKPSKAFHLNNKRQQKKKNIKWVNEDTDLSDSSLEILSTMNLTDIWRNIQIDPMEIAFTIKSNRSWPKVIKISNENPIRYKMRIKYEIDWNCDKNKAILKMLCIKKAELRGTIQPKKTKTIRLKVNTEFIKEKGENIKNVDAALWISLIVRNCGGQTLRSQRPTDSQRPIKITFV